VLHKKFPVIKVAVSVGLMTQIHLLSSIMLALMLYFPFYYTFSISLFLKCFFKLAGLIKKIWAKLFKQKIF
ncbi:hypothetical protein EFP6CTSP_19910, partial [Enterococcus faecium]